jgi:uncharacterized protein YecE (DUF72 family)
MAIWVGTSGYNYPEWKGSVLSGDAASGEDAAVLRRAVSDRRDQLHVLPAPNEKILDGWNKATPERFKLTLKAPKRITHDARLRDCGDRVRQFLETAARSVRSWRAAVSAAAEPQEGPRALRRVSRHVSAARAAPRSSSATLVARRRGVRRLRARNLALCVADSEKLSTPVEITADYAYFRLRDEGYTRTTSRGGPA